MTLWDLLLCWSLTCLFVAVSLTGACHLCAAALDCTAFRLYPGFLERPVGCLRNASSLKWQHDWPCMPMEALMDLGVAGNFLVHC